MDLVVLIDRPGFAVTGCSRLLKRAEAAVIDNAAALLDRVEAHDRSRRDQALVAQEAARERGHAQGVAAAQALWSARLAAAEAARFVAMDRLAPTLASIVVDAAEVVLTGASHEQLVGAALNAVSDRLRQVRWARLRVHPDELADAEAALGDWQVSVASARLVGLVTLVGDPSLRPGACLFETDLGTADASLTVQLAAIRKALEAAIVSLGDAPAESLP